MDINAWALVFSVIAAFASVIVARWEWYDRPRLVWRIRQFRPDQDRWPSHKAHVHADGSDAALAVEIRCVGYRGYELKDDRRSRMIQGSDPLEVLFEPYDDESDAFIEITWSSDRPRRRHGQRLNTATGEWEVWRWYWRSLRARRDRAALRGPLRRWTRYIEFRLVRTRGRWVPIDARPLHDIPMTVVNDPPRPEVEGSPSI